MLGELLWVGLTQRALVLTSARDIPEPRGLANWDQMQVKHR